MLAALAEFENSLRAERCEGGRRAAIARGGSSVPRKLTDEQVEEMREKRENVFLSKNSHRSVSVTRLCTD